MAVWLLYYAAKAGHREAELEYNDLPTDSANPILVNGPRSQDYDKAVAGDQAAINYLIITYLLFPIFDDDRQKGYYWLHRSRDFGVTKKTRDALLKSISFLSASERNQAKGWIKSGRVPPI